MTEQGTRAFLKETLALDERTIDECLSLSPDTKYDNRQAFLHLIVVGCRLDDGALAQDRVDVLIGEGWFLTLHREPVPFLETVKANYHDDFVRYARSPGFLLYELFDALVDSYEELATRFDGEVESL